MERNLLPRTDQPRAEGVGPVPVELLPTGIEGLDDVLGGGFPNRSVITLIGEPGSGTSTLAQQALHNRAVVGGKVAYYTVGSTGLGVIQDMLVHGWTVDNQMKSKAWTFVGVETPELQDLLAPISHPLEEKVTVDQTLNSLKRDFLSRVQDGCWTTIDSISYLLLEFSPKDVFNLTIYLATAARVYGGVHLITVSEGVHDPQTLNTLRLLSDGVIEFVIRERTRSFEGSLLIKKMRGSYRPRMIPFSITDRGITIETAIRIA